MSASYNNGTVTFAPGQYFDTLVHSHGTASILPVTVVQGFTASDYLDLQSYPPPGYPTPIGPVQLINAAPDTVIEGVTFVGASASFYYEVAGDTQGGEVVEAINYLPGECLAAGTLIGTPDGERPVETLCPGDHVLCHAGGAPVARAVVACHTWQYDPDAVPAAARRDGAPIRIAAGAMAEAVPRRDLAVSPNHAIFAEGMLVPARQLINGLSIVQDLASRAIRYVHIEVVGHDIMAAEGLLVETRLPDAAAVAAGARSRTAGGAPCRIAGSTRPHAHAPAGGWSQAWEAQGCAPLVVCGPALDALRARLFARAACGCRFASQGRAAA